MGRRELRSAAPTTAQALPPASATGAAPTARGTGPLRQLRWTGVLVPVVGITALNLLRPVLAPTERHLLALDAVVAVLAVGFGLAVLYVADRAYRQAVQQNQELARAHAARARLVADLRRRQQESAALSEVLLQVSEQQPLSTTLTAVVGHARDLLGARAAGLCLPPAAGRLAALDGTVRLGPTGQLCAVGESLRACPSTVDQCPLPDLAGGRERPSAPVRTPDGTAGELWLDRDPDVATTAEDRRFLTDLAELAAVALDHARMVESERDTAIVGERSRIAREMHDTLAQVLGVTHLRLLALHATPGLPAEAGREVAELADICNEAYLDVRESILGLREASRSDRALAESLRTYVEKFSRQSRVPTTLVLEPGIDLDLGPQAEIQVIRVIQEALTNVRKHARARAATVEIRRLPGHTVFVVSDDGVGFVPGAAPDRYGLLSMRERTEQIGGRLTVESAPGEGTRVVARVPHLVGAVPPEEVRG